MFLLILTFFFLGREISSAGVFNVKNYGAKGDNITSDTDAIQKTFQACNASGGGTVYFPDGSYRVTTLDLISNVEVVFSSSKSQILFFNDYENWPTMPTVDEYNGYNAAIMYKSLITGINLKNISIRGNGILNGNGERWWDAWMDGKLKYRRPNLLHLKNCDDIHVSDITLTYSPCYHFYSYIVNRLEIDHLSVHVPFFKKSRNTDGIDLKESHDVHIHDCTIFSGDDNVAIMHGTSRVLVENCEFGTGHGASVGSLRDDNSAQDIIFRNIKFEGTRYGCRVKTWANWTGIVKNITWENISMKEVEQSIRVNMFFGSPTTFETIDDKITTGKISDLYMKDIFSIEGQNAGIFMCREEDHCENIFLKDIAIFAKHEKEFQCQYAYGDAVRVHPKSCLK